MQKVKDGAIEVMDRNFKKSTIPADTVVISAGLKSNNALYKDVASTVPDTYVIGDASSARNIMYAIWDAYELARSI
jgi:2-enoate reductase